MEWTVVSKSRGPAEEEEVPQESSSSSVKLTKQQLRNKKRSEKRKEKQPLVVPMSPPPPRVAATRDSEEEEQATDSSDEELELYGELSRRFRRLSKTAKQIAQARHKITEEEEDVDVGTNDAQLRAKVARGPQVSAELEACRADLAVVEDKRAARRVAKTAVAAEVARLREAEANLVLSVSFDDKFACPICTEVVEAAVTVPRSCDHVFCRACLEDHVAKAAKASDCVCPLCRKQLCDRATGRVEAKRCWQFRLKHELGRCHCGEDMPLSKLRDHLRHCGPKAHLFPPRRKFGHEFRQPAFAAPSPSSSSSSRGGGGGDNTGGQGGRRNGPGNNPNKQQQQLLRQHQRSLDADRQEQIHLQAALLASIADR